MKLMVIIFSLFALCCNICTAQNKIEGRVTFIGNTPVENAIIVVKALTDKGERIVANTTTNKQGLYAVTLSSDNKRLVLYVSGFDINTLRKEIANTPQTIDFVAEPRNFELQEVFVKPTSIEAKGDTLTYNIALFKDKNDRILRETLERMPGISVNDAGKVLYNGREITEFQIEGNNLFENKYSIALDRIDPKDIVAVDVMQHHQPIRALQGSRITDDVAINLKLSANAKDNLSGKMEMGGGYRDGNRSNLVYTAHLYGGLFNARQQLFATTAINNSGDQLRSVYAVPLRMLQENILSTTTPQNSILGQNDYMTNQSKALSLNGLYKNAENSKWSYAVTAINENTEGHTDIERAYYVGKQEIKHERNLAFGNAFQNVDHLLKYEKNAPRCYLMNKLVGTWKRDLPYVNQDIQSTRLEEHLCQKEYTLDNQLQMIHRWNDVNGLDTRFNLHYSNKHENLTLRQGAGASPSPSAEALQKVRQHFYFAELRQEMLSTIKFGGWIIDPYWFGLADKTTLSTTMCSSISLSSPENTFVPDDNVHYNRVKAGIGLTIHSTVARFRIYGYIPLVYSHITAYTPYISPKRHALHIDPNLTIERPLAPYLSLQIQWTQEFQDNKPDDLLRAFIIRNSYEQTQASIKEITSTDYQRLGAKLNYANAFNRLIGNLHIEYTRLNSDMMTNKVVRNDHLVLFLTPQAYGTNSLNLGGEVAKTFYWKKANVGIKANRTRFSSSQMLNGTKLPFVLYESSILLRGSIIPVKGVLTEIHTFINRSRMSRQKENYTDVITTRFMLSGKIMATINRWSVVCKALYCQQDHSHTFLSNLKAYYRTKTAEWSLSIHNLLNAKKLSMTSVNAQERERNTFYLVPRNLILSLNLIL